MRRTALAALAAAGVLAAAAATAQGASFSSNWAGYVAVPRAHGAGVFTAVSGTWTEPTVTCTGTTSASAFWVGLGGDDENSPGLEQIGTDADCERGGTPSYYAWYELIPAESVNIRIAIHPGDVINGFTSVHGHYVTLHLTDETTHETFKRRRYDHYIDLSSAEWIVEAPSTCTRPGRCAPTALSDFGSIEFANAFATAARHTDPIASRRWHAGSIDMVQAPVHHVDEPPTVVTASPTGKPTRTGGFTVEWHSGVSTGPQFRLRRR
ncbi:MAG TPA: G1 family glutamic endopeptidase [Solirubrobacteraceae bacterium]|nr:G1 family glutamic endopeptidase [Solirubrobacteraceae bacterium]